MAKLNRFSNLFPIEEMSEQDQMLSNALQPAVVQESAISKLFTPEELELSPNQFPGTVGRPMSDMAQAEARAKAIRDAKAAQAQQDAEANRFLSERVADRELPVLDPMPKVNTSATNVRPLDISPGSNVLETPEPELDADVVAAAKQAVEDDNAQNMRSPASDEAQVATRPVTDNSSALLDLLRAGQMVGAGLGGMGTGKVLTADPAALDAIQKNIRNRELDAVAKQGADSKLELESLSKTEKKAAIEKEQELNDPNSEVSKSYRDQVLALFPQYANSPGISSASAKQLGETFKFLNLKEQIDARKENAKLFAAQKQEAEELKKEQKEETKQAKLDDKLNKQVAQVAKQVETTGIGEMLGQLNRIEALAGTNKDLPGFGMAASALPNFLTSQEGVDLRQEVAGLRNAILKARSGAAITPQEADRLLEEIGTSTFATEATLRRGLANARQLLQSKTQNISASVPPEAVKEYINRGGVNVEEAAKSTKKPPLRRKLQDGRIALFDADTKQFIEYEK